jgi:hypothetical protein
MKNRFDQHVYDLRVKKGMLPTVDVVGHTFYVDIRMDMLRPKDDFLSKGIVFSDIQSYYDTDKQLYTIPYNPKTHEFQEPDYLTITEPPRDLIAIRFLSERILDRVGWNRKYGFELTNGLSEQGLKLQFTAARIPWEKTWLNKIININMEAEMKQSGNSQLKKEQSLTKPKFTGRKI